MKSKLSFALLLTAIVALSSLPSFAAAGAVYTLNNSNSGNAVLAFNRSADGQIVFAGMAATGGTGTGTGLGNQGALAIDAANQFLFAVNAGSNDISIFRIRANGLRLVDRIPSGGKQPISLTVSRKVLYVLNNGAAVGGSDTIAGFGVGADGHLKPIVSGLSLVHDEGDVFPERFQGRSGSGTHAFLRAKITDHQSGRRGRNYQL